MTFSKNGFTYIEMLVTIVIVSTCFVPIMQLFSAAVTNAASTQELVVGLNLVREEMEKIKNLNYTEEKLRQEGKVMHPREDKPPMVLSGINWRVAREIRKGSDPLELAVKSYRVDGEKYELIAELVTLIEDLH